jgi:F-type H+-transporting ATPase subunit delta
MNVPIALIVSAWMQGLSANEQLRATNELVLIEGSLRDPKTRAFIVNPFIASAQKHKVFVQAGISKAAAALLLWIDRQRLWGRLSEIRAQAKHAVRRQTGQQDAAVWSAVPLTAAELTRLKKKLEKKFQQEVSLTTRVVPDLIGGLVVDVSGSRLDFSVRGKLRALRSAIIATT